MELDKLALVARELPAGELPLVHSPVASASQRRGDTSPRDGPALPDPSPAMGLEIFFSTPPAPVLPAGPDLPRQVQSRRRRVYDMSKVRRSARLAMKPVMAAEKKAQINLCRQLGLAEEEQATMEEVLRDYIAMFSGPLPEHVIAALSTFFDLHSELAAEVLDGALLELAGDGLDDLLEAAAMAGQ